MNGLVIRSGKGKHTFINKLCHRDFSHVAIFRMEVPNLPKSLFKFPMLFNYNKLVVYKYIFLNHARKTYHTYVLRNGCYGRYYCECSQQEVGNDLMDITLQALIDRFNMRPMIVLPFAKSDSTC